MAHQSDQPPTMDYATPPPPQRREISFSRIRHGIFAIGAGLLGISLTGLALWGILVPIPGMRSRPPSGSVQIALFGLLCLLLCVHWAYLALKGK